MDGYPADIQISKGVKMLDLKTFESHHGLNVQERVVCLFLVNLPNLHLQILTFGTQVFGKRHPLFVVYSRDDTECLLL